MQRLPFKNDIWSNRLTRCIFVAIAEWQLIETPQLLTQLDVLRFSSYKEEDQKMFVQGG